MSKETIEKIHEETGRVYGIAHDLYAYSNAFSVTGNREVGIALKEFADILLEAQENINSSVYKWIDEDFKQSQRNSVNVLRAAMAGVEIGSGDNETDQ